ncbi:MAG: hypothetical protein Q7J10_05060 [Methanosarcinaceae archaeon]|nr:hypothetical protein [Methanosarcinaceae archaeon]
MNIKQNFTAEYAEGAELLIYSILYAFCIADRGLFVDRAEVSVSV